MVAVGSSLRDPPSPVQDLRSRPRWAGSGTRGTNPRLSKQQELFDFCLCTSMVPVWNVAGAADGNRHHPSLLGYDAALHFTVTGDQEAKLVLPLLQWWLGFCIFLRNHALWFTRALYHFDVLDVASERNTRQDFGPWISHLSDWMRQPSIADRLALYSSMFWSWPLRSAASFVYLASILDSYDWLPIVVSD